MVSPGIYRMYPFTITVDGQVCASVSDNGNRPRSYDVTCPSIMYGQVVRFSRTSDTDMLNLCEFEVFGKYQLCVYQQALSLVQNDIVLGQE